MGKPILSVVLAAMTLVASLSIIRAAPLPGEPGAQSPGSVGDEPDRRLPPPVPPDKQIPRRPREQQDSWSIPRKDLPPKTRMGSFDSDITRRSVSYLVYLPPDYDRIRNEKMRYPVIYMLPSSGDARESGPMILKIDEAITDNKIPPVIVVSVQGIYGSLYVDARDRGRPIEAVIVRELVARIDSTFRTIPDREHRALEGFAMGGYGAAHLAFRNPDVFGVVSMFAPTLGPFEAFQDEMPMIVTDVFGDDRRYFAENDPWVLLGRNVDRIRGRMKIRMYCGAEDRYAVFAEDFHARLNQLGVEHEYRLVPKGTRDLNKMLLGVRSRVLPFWKEVFPPYVPPATTQSTSP